MYVIAQITQTKIYLLKSYAINKWVLIELRATACAPGNTCTGLWCLGHHFVLVELRLKFMILGNMKNNNCVSLTKTTKAERSKKTVHTLNLFLSPITHEHNRWKLFCQTSYPHSSWSTPSWCWSWRRLCPAGLGRTGGTCPGAGVNILQKDYWNYWIIHNLKEWSSIERGQDRS